MLNYQFTCMTDNDRTRGDMKSEILLERSVTDR